jgi:hypothetical protein
MEKVTKAELVRGMIFAAKQQNKDAVSLIADVMQHFGFGRQLARTYILKNWERVQVAAQAEAQATVQAELETAKEQTKRALSMSKDAIRKREQRAAKRAAAAAVA